MIGYLPHLITFVLVIAITIMAFLNMFYIHNAHKAPFLRQMLYIMCIFQILTMLTFTANQIGWIVNEHESIVGFEAQIGWLAYDYQNKLFHLTAAAVLHYYLKFKHIDPVEANRRRSTDD
jgi:hypothetical protein